jgi:hypothetical protein
VYIIRKLKPDRDYRNLLVPLAVLVGGAFVGAFFGPAAVGDFIAAVFWAYALYSFITFLRTHNAGFVVVACFQLTAGLLIYSAPPSDRGLRRGLILFFAACEFFFLVWLIFLAVTKKIKWRGRELLELAAQPVDDAAAGYTSRPLPAGRTDLGRREILEFAEFARKNLIAVPYVGKDQVVFVLVRMWREFGFILGLKSDWTDETWVSFDYEGHATVNISHRDYLSYQEALSFERLCRSLGDLFVEFVEMFGRGEGERIIDRLDAVGLSYFA